MVDSLPRTTVGRDLVWVLTSRSRPHPEALRRLVAAGGRYAELWEAWSG